MSNESSTTRSRRVLVAEDETLIRLDIVETLTDAGYEIVAEAADGEEAVRLADALSDRFLSGKQVPEQRRPEPGRGVSRR